MPKLTMPVAEAAQPATARYRVEIPLCLVPPGIVEAKSEAGALAKYMADNGILSTSQLPNVKRLDSQTD